MVSGIIYVIRCGLHWKNASSGYGSTKTLYNRFVRWSRLGVFGHVFAALGAQSGVPEQLTIDCIHLNRTAPSLFKTAPFPNTSAALASA
ncbi:transposase [Acetobacteraceae bacterium KSS8]|uniref:Transposase n=1 Tax=Endosaccharibacter trunci TaxID=2812733 RepID=A0ABT1W452_9PROT|nr:transposase [Acetobacteraceae bacterium KSS8]